MKQEFYYMPNGITSKIHNKIAPAFSGMLGEDEKIILLKKFKKRLSKLEKEYYQDLVKQTVVMPLALAARGTTLEYDVLIKTTPVLKEFSIYNCRRSVTYRW